MRPLKRETVVKTGIAGSVIAAFCCFTPVLAIGFGAVGLSAWLAFADYILLPLLVGFVGLTAFGLLWRIKATTQCPPTVNTNKDRA